ncbi:surfactant protein Ba [Chanos chanos]|uniref:Surfactant protein Ba n=1 Tax=Chanos chanos TaxID=29144 RepID=A0A6J2V1X1_CHACN|nr:prosaposin-like [Chanos chanos]
MAGVNLVLLGFLALLAAARARSVDAAFEDVRMTMSGDSCKDCTQIMELVKDLISDQDVQTKIKTSLDKLCSMLPAPASKICQNQVDQKLPIVITFITGIIQPGQVCTFLGLCDGQSSGKNCVHMIRNVREALMSQPAETAVADLLGGMCGALPPFFRVQCEGIIQRYIKMLFDMFLSPTSPNSICSLLRLCQNQELPLIRVTPAVSDCDSCLTLVVLTRLRLGSNATEDQTTSFLDTVCRLHPSALPKCESFTQRHGRQLRGVLGQNGAALHVCEKADLCAPVKKMPVTAGDPCTLGVSYRCKDFQTALACGAVSFCQRNVWK